VGWRQIHHSTPSPLPYGIAVHPTMKMCSIILVRVVPVYLIQQVVDLRRDKPWLVGARLH
jgi:hypothetical protein